MILYVSLFLGVDADEVVEPANDKEMGGKFGVSSFLFFCIPPCSMGYVDGVCPFKLVLLLLLLLGCHGFFAANDTNYNRPKNSFH